MALWTPTVARFYLSLAVGLGVSDGQASLMATVFFDSLPFRIGHAIPLWKLKHLGKGKGFP